MKSASTRAFVALAVGGIWLGLSVVGTIIGASIFVQPSVITGGVPSLGAGTPFKDVDPLVFAVPVSFS